MNNLEAGFFEPPHNTLNPRLFEIKTEQMLSNVKKEIYERLYSYFEDTGYLHVEKWTHLYLIGSSASYQWDDNGDIDLTVWADFEEFKKIHARHNDDDEDIRCELVGAVMGDLDNLDLFTEDFDIISYRWDEKTNLMEPKVNGKDASLEDLENSRMPVNYFLIPELFLKSYAAYDIDEGKWIIRPPQLPEDYSPEVVYQEQFARAQDEMTLADVLLMDYRRNLMDYDFLQAFSDREGITDQLAIKGLAIQDDALAITDFVGQIQNERHEEFQEAEEYSMEMQGNFNYKTLSHYGYMTVFDAVKEIVEEGNEVSKHLELYRSGKTIPKADVGGEE